MRSGGEATPWDDVSWIAGCEIPPKHQSTYNPFFFFLLPPCFPANVATMPLLAVSVAGARTHTSLALINPSLGSILVTITGRGCCPSCHLSHLAALLTAHPLHLPELPHSSHIFIFLLSAVLALEPPCHRAISAREGIQPFSRAGKKPGCHNGI